MACKHFRRQGFLTILQIILQVAVWEKANAITFLNWCFCQGGFTYGQEPSIIFCPPRSISTRVNLNIVFQFPALAHKRILLSSYKNQTHTHTHTLNLVLLYYQNLPPWFHILSVYVAPSHPLSGSAVIITHIIWSLNDRIANRTAHPPSSARAAVPASRSFTCDMARGCCDDRRYWRRSHGTLRRLRCLRTFVHAHTEDFRDILCKARLLKKICYRTVTHKIFQK